jgi:hypothetical protein
MPGRRAKILSGADVGDLLVFASCTRHPLAEHGDGPALGQGRLTRRGDRKPRVGHGGRCHWPSQRSA